MPPSAKRQLPELLREFLSDLPEPTALLKFVPIAITSVAVGTAIRLAEDICKRRGEIYDFDLIFERYIADEEFLNVSALFGVSCTLLLQIILTGYLATQYFYQRRLTPIPVELAQFKTALIASESFSLEAYLPDELDRFLSLVSRRVVEKLIASEQDIDPPFTLSEWEFPIIRALATGSIFWQLAESIWSGRSEKPANGTRVFLSYSSKDRNRVRTFRTALERYGYDIWIDEKDIRVGEPLLDRVSSGISKEADFMIIFLTKHSIDSNWVKVEMRLAYEREIDSGFIFLLPVLLTDCKLPDQLRIKKYADARRGYAKCADEISNAIRWHLRSRPFDIEAP